VYAFPDTPKANNYLQEVIGDDAKFFSRSEVLEEFLAGNRKYNSDNNVRSQHWRPFRF
jgi:hypothetical protein